VLGNDHDIFLPLAQRRNHDGHDIQPIKQILSKPPLSHFLSKVFLCGADQAHIDVNRVVASDTPQTAVPEVPARVLPG